MKLASKSLGTNIFLRIIFSLTLIFSAGTGGELFAGDDLPEVAPGEKAPIDSVFHEPLSRGLALVYSDRFEEANALFDSVKQLHPNHPAPYFYKAAVLQSWMSTYRFNKFQDELEENIQTAIEKGNELLKKQKDDPWLNFYVGAAYGYRAFYRFRSFNWIGAYMDGKKGVGNFKKAEKKDKRLYDVYLGFGTYHYWRTARSGFIRVVAFWMKDKRELGLKQMRFAIDHGQYCTDEALFGYFYSLFDYERYDEAEVALNEFLERSEGDPPILAARYFQGRLKAHNGSWIDTQSIFEEILTRIDAQPYRSVGFQVECKYWIARSMSETGRSAEALALTNEAIALSDTRNDDEELEGALNGFDEVKDWLKELKKTLTKEL